MSSAILPAYLKEKEEISNKQSNSTPKRTRKRTNRVQSKYKEGNNKYQNRNKQNNTKSIKNNTKDHPGQVVLLEHCPLHQKVVGLIASQGTYLGCRFDPWSVYRRQSINVSHSHHCFSSCLCLINKHILE